MVLNNSVELWVADNETIFIGTRLCALNIAHAFGVSKLFSFD